ncbi:Protein phosphatase 1 regulatory subunit 15A [Clarias magur]|uniref:Protein phosphatase 1 regulatory subunit 15A n=1 Tax=Clarias magur TaxID=1594786 RepID=A0A8J4U6Q2_CLAMG|nr:Protein phosphatase 1 regulatory subunit 15A [Clarias magur]
MPDVSVANCLRSVNVLPEPAPIELSNLVDNIQVDIHPVPIAHSVPVQGPGEGEISLRCTGRVTAGRHSNPHHLRRAELGLGRRQASCV